MIPASESSQPGREDSPCGGGVRGTTVKMTRSGYKLAGRRGGKGTAAAGVTRATSMGSLGAAGPVSLRGALEINCHQSMLAVREKSSQRDAKTLAFRGAVNSLLMT